MRLLADTSALVAMALRRDGNHRPAVEFARREKAARFVVTDLVLAETTTILRMRGDAESAARFGRSLLDSRRYELLFVNRDIVDGALGAMERFGDKRLSLADCASFEVIRRLGLDGAFTFDRDFRDCGFPVRP